MNSTISLDTQNVNGFSVSDFLELFGGEHQWFTALNEKQGHEKPKTRLNQANAYSEIEEKLHQLNSEGCGVFFAPNKVEGRRKDANVKLIRALFLDLDGSPLEPVLNCPLSPTVVVETSPERYHVYWITTGVEVDQFKALQTAIAAKFGGDPHITDPSRLMRLPHFFHNKSQPFLSRIVSLDKANVYSLDRVLFDLDLDMVQIVNPKDSARFELPNSVLEGQRNITMFKYGCRLRAKGMDDGEITDELTRKNQSMCVPPLGQPELDSVISSVLGYKPGSLANSDLDLGNGFMPMRWAEEFLKCEKLFFLDGFFRFNGQYYEPVDNDLIEANLQKMANNRMRIRHVDEVLRALRVMIKDKGQPEPNPPGYLCLKNCVVNTDTGKGQPHTDRLFLTYQLSYDHIKDAQCKLWDQTLMEILPDPLSRRLLQEYSGYTLTTSTKHQVCLFMHGTGGNGKSMILEVIQALLGGRNYTSLDLESLSDKFMRHSLKEKLANFSSELGVGKIKNSHFFKQLVDGSSMTVDKKYATDPIEFSPYAKFWIASNSYLDSNDNSYGFLRRFLFLKFDQVFTGANVDLSRASRIIRNELPGVFNWALRGLEMLHHDKGFKPLPQCHRDMLSTVRSSIDPKFDFIHERLEYRQGEKSFLKNIFQVWKEYLGDFGGNEGTPNNLKIAIIQHFSRAKEKRTNSGIIIENVALVHPKCPDG